MTRCRPHPISILIKVKSFLLLILLPVLRGFLSALQGGLMGWLSGAWFDILVLLAILLMATLSWACTSYHWDERGFFLSYGVLHRKHLFVSSRQISTITVLHSYYLAPLRAVWLKIDTLAGGSRKSDILLAAKRRDAMQAVESSSSSLSFQGHYRLDIRSLLTWSVLTSNSLMGILFVSTLISQAGRLLGEEFSHRLVGAFHEITMALAFQIPPAAAAIAIALVSGWLIAFLFTLSRYSRFLVSRRQDQLEITGGIGTKRHYLLNINQLNFADIRQNVLVRLMNYYSLYISSVGFAKSKDDVSALIPTVKSKRFFSLLDQLLPEFHVSPATVRPIKKAAFRYLYPPVLIVLAIPAAGILLSWYFPQWSDFLTFICGMLLLPAGFYLLLRFYALRFSGVGYSDGFFTIRYFTGYNLHTVVIPASRISKIEVRQTVFQLVPKACDLVIYSYAENRRAHRCIQLPIQEVQAFLKNI